MRRFLWLSLGALLLASVAVASSGGATQSEARWVITDLGTLGGPGSKAIALNERGQIVGLADTKAKDKHGFRVRHAFLWEKGKIRDLGKPFFDPELSALAINERGQIVGLADTQGGAVLWERGKPHRLGMNLGGACYVSEDDPCLAINDRGQVVGSAYTGKFSHRDPIGELVLWEKEKRRNLGTLAGLDTYPVAINERAQIVGWADVADEQEGRQSHGFIWEEGEMIDLGRFHPETINERGQIVGNVERPVYDWPAVWEEGTLRVLPKPPKSRPARAVDINSTGTAVGVCMLSGPGDHARPCMWRDGKGYVLGLVYGDRGRAVAVNDRAQIIGSSRTMRHGRTRGTIWDVHTHTDAGPLHAFVWQGGKMTDLGTLPGGEESEAVAINNRGQIIGWSDTKSGASHAVLWTLKR
jgi:probable HAF family extracellular repeat protein